MQQYSPFWSYKKISSKFLSQVFGQPCLLILKENQPLVKFRRSIYVMLSLLLRLRYRAFHNLCRAFIEFLRAQKYFILKQLNYLTLSYLLSYSMHSQYYCKASHTICYLKYRIYLYYKCLKHFIELVWVSYPIQSYYTTLGIPGTELLL